RRVLSCCLPVIRVSRGAARCPYTTRFRSVGRMRVVLYHRLGTLAEMAGIFAKNHANVITLEQTHVDDPFHTYEVDLEAQDLAHRSEEHTSELQSREKLVCRLLLEKHSNTA